MSHQVIQLLRLPCTIQAKKLARSEDKEVQTDDLDSNEEGYSKVNKYLTIQNAEGSSTVRNKGAESLPSFHSSANDTPLY